MKIINDKLQGDTIEYSESPNQGGKFNPGDLDTIIIHFTAGALVAVAKIHGIF